MFLARAADRSQYAFYVIVDSAGKYIAYRYSHHDRNGRWARTNFSTWVRDHYDLSFALRIAVHADGWKRGPLLGSSTRLNKLLFHAKNYSASS